MVVHGNFLESEAVEMSDRLLEIFGCKVLSEVPKDNITMLPQVFEHLPS